MILVVGLVAYLVFALKQSRKESENVHQEYAREFGDTEKHSAANTLKNIVLIVIGLGLLVLGARWLVESASTMAKAAGISELVVGLTVVAVGTSLPEVATSLIAAWKGESDIAVGNAIGSNIFNLLGVLGLSGVLAPGGIEVAPRILTFDFLVMVFVALVCMPVFYVDDDVSRGEGVLFLSYYVIYTAYLILEASKSSILPGITLFVSFYIPLTFIALVMFTVRAARLKRNKRNSAT